MRYLSLCSGIEAASVAWGGLGWTAVAFSEIEPFCCALLRERFSHVPNLGDMTGIDGGDFYGAVDLVVGGTPCQGFSRAGLRRGMLDERSGLARDFVRIVSGARPRWIVWENVPGALSTAGGRDFGAFVGALDACGYSLAWRVLDAQYFGLPQQRRRLFLVGHHRDWRRAAQVLFEPESLFRTGEKGRKKGEVFPCLTGNGAKALDDTTPFVLEAAGARRATPREWERLMGFPDDWTAIPGAADFSRYRALGNSMAVPVMRWLGERIKSVEEV
ncbi:DNA cytosine methyltransferase [Desulfovibrio piger]|uniref:DNA cytosine methyltransferase n=1 Tax=Desulfovibrio piger TaxID=901 RepID=UPI0026ED4660|nr:DNA cytosine methyltransferase [Desulfovibrio piger]